VWSTGLDLIARLQEVFLTRPYEEWEELLLEHGIPVGAINTSIKSSSTRRSKRVG